MSKSDRKAKYHQWDNEDSLTIQDTRFELRRRLEKLYKRYIPEQEVNHILKQMEQINERGYLR